MLGSIKEKKVWKWRWGTMENGADMMLLAVFFLHSYEKPRLTMSAPRINQY